MIKLFVSDMDGTLLNHQHVISERTALAIKKLQSSSVEFLIATGRDFGSAHHLLRVHGIKCQMINLNGASFADINDTITAPNPLDISVTREILTYLHEHNIEHTLMALDGFYVPDQQKYIHRIKKFLANTTLQANGEKDIKISDLTDAQLMEHLHDIKQMNLSILDNEDLVPLKIMIMSDHATDLIQFKKKFEKHLSLDITSSNPDNLEITSKQAQKGLAILQYAKENGYRIDEIVTIGDSLNDRSMLQLIPNSYAMDNASEQVKKMANYLAPSNAEDGVATVIEQVIVQNKHEMN